jgi:hypothetical protein
MIRVRRSPSSLPFVRTYTLDLRGEQLTVRRGTAVRRLESFVGVGDAWSFINESDRQWAAGNRDWAVGFDEGESQADDMPLPDEVP